MQTKTKAKAVAVAVEASGGLLGAREASRWLGVSERQLDRLKRDHGLPFVPVGPRLIKYRLAALEAWAASQEKRAECEA